MEPPPIDTRPPSPHEDFLYQRFREEVVHQVNRLDELARQFLTLELAIPGLYATVLKLAEGPDATLDGLLLLGLTFGLWFLALAASLFCLFPLPYRVDPNLIRGNPLQDEGVGMSIEAFYQRSARRKWWLLLGGTLSFLGGISCAVISIL